MSIKAEMMKAQAIYDEEVYLDGAPAWARTSIEIKIESMRDTPAEDFLGYNACATPKESTELY